MSEPDAADAVEETADEGDPDAAEHDGEEEPPEIPEEDQADLPADLAAAAEETAGAGADENDESDAESDADEDTTETTADADGASEPASAAAEGDTYGDLYAQTLVSVTNAAIDEHGKEGAEHTDIEAARQLGINEHADRLMEEMGVGKDMPPGQALMASSGMFVLMNLAAKTDLPAQMMGDFDL